MLKVLVLVEGSANSSRAASYAANMASLYKEPPELHLLNVQRPFPGTIRGVHEQAAQHHHDEGIKALAGVRQQLDAAGLKYVYHISVGEAGETIAHFVKDQQIEQLVRARAASVKKTG